MKIVKRILGIIIVLAVVILGWFYVPYSPVVSEFRQLKSEQLSDVNIPNEVLTKEEISGLPYPVQRYIEYCGFIGKSKIANMKMIHNDVDFILSSKQLKIDSIQYNSADKPERVALMETGLYGVPFEGIDSYQNGIGSMKGVLGKSITLFNQKGEAMNRSSLVNCLAESLLMPSFALQDFMHWEEIDQNHAKATLTYYSISVTGIFSFNKKGWLESFTTDNRVYVDTNGDTKQVKWSAISSDYRDINGIKQPKSLQAIWHLPEGDLLYFDSHDTLIQYNTKE